MTQELRDQMPVNLCSTVPKSFSFDDVAAAMNHCRELENYLSLVQRYLMGVAFASYFQRNPEALLFVIGAPDEFVDGDSFEGGYYVLRVDGGFVRETSFRTLQALGEHPEIGASDSFRLQREQYAYVPSSDVQSAVEAMLDTLHSRPWLDETLLLSNLNDFDKVGSGLVKTKTASLTDWADLLPGGLSDGLYEVVSFRTFITPQLETWWATLSNYSDATHVGRVYRQSDLPEIFSNLRLSTSADAVLAQIESERLQSNLVSSSEVGILASPSKPSSRTTL